MLDVFQKIYDDNGWRSDESVSGHGSTLAQTKTIREELPILFQEYDIRTVVDIPCGDYNWFRYIKFNQPIMYLGADIVPEIVERNKIYATHDHTTQFAVMDITRDKLPPADLLLVRDLLGHFSNADVRKALVNIKSCGAKYLLATTFPAHENSGDIQTGQWRPINLAQMWGLGDPLEYMMEDCSEADGAFNDKALGLWKL
jgi:hypothetical protein